MPLFSSAHATVVQSSHLCETTTTTIGDTILYENRSGPTYEVHVEHAGLQEPVLEKLRRHTFSAALHDSQARCHPPRCHPGTRRSILNNIEYWAYNVQHPLRQPCLWLSGPAGAGKSAIAQTLVETWRSQHLLAASFFFPRGPDGCPGKHTVITTIAYQLAVSFPHFLPHIETVINGDPLIFSKSLESQMEQLIIHPLRQGSLKNPSFHSSNKVIVIDGLDKWGSIQDARELLSLFIDVLNKYKLPLILLITSRPEPHICEVFDNLPNPFTTLQLVLDDEFQPEADIELYIQYRFDQLKRSRCRAVGISWPPKGAVPTILARTSGQFLYASAAIDHICHSRGDPQRLLEEIIKGTHKGASPLAEVDAAFKEILESVTPSSLPIVTDILAWLSIYRHGDMHDGTLAQLELAEDTHQPPLSPPWLEHILDLQCGEIYTHLISLHSLFNVPGRGTSQALRVYHECLFEFLSDTARAGVFFMDTPIAHGRVARCLSRHVIKANCRPPTTFTKLDIIAERFRFHLSLSSPSRDLRQDVERLAGLRYHRSNTSWKNRTDSSHRSSLATFTCDTRRAILRYLERCYEVHPSSPFRQIIAKAHLTLFWFRDIYLQAPCQRQACSCQKISLS